MAGYGGCGGPLPGIPGKEESTGDPGQTVLEEVASRAIYGTAFAGDMKRLENPVLVQLAQKPQNRNWWCAEDSAVF